MIEPTQPAQRDAASPDGLDASVRLARLRRRMFARIETPRIAEYHVLRQIGGGGMGLVFAAWDPSLDRVIAIKVLRDPSSPKAAERLRREAVALARLRHSNVVPVYEVGEHEGQVYLAMEFVEGQTLREWTRRWRSESRSMPELLGVFLQAARALVAAHHAGLTHGDVKPENIMIDGDGRVRVMDFGLARQDATEVTDERPPPLSGRGSVVTGHTRGLYGTPAYMAPEQFQGVVAGPSADQFALCACLFEALYGRKARPERLDEAAAVAEEPVVVPPQRGVPRRMQALLRRGLAVSPERRWPSMRALADELSRMRRPRLVRLAVVAGLGIAAIGALGGRALAPPDVPAPAIVPEPPCQTVPEGLLDDDDRTALIEVFTRVGTSSRDQLSARVRGQLDAYADAWAQQYLDSCRATHVRYEQSEWLFDQRLQCLQRRRTRLRSVVEALVTAETAAQLDERTMGAFRLPELDACDDAEALAAEAPLPVDPDERDRVLRLREQVDHALTRRDVGDFAQARELAQRAVAEARRLDQPTLLAEGLSALAGAEVSLGHGSAAEVAAHEAVEIAARSGDAHTEAVAWTELLFSYLMQGRSQKGLELEFAATMAVQRGGDEVVRGWLLNNLGGLHSDVGNVQRGLELLRQSVEVKTAHFGPEHVDVGISWHNLAIALHTAGLSHEARDAAARARRIVEGTVGRGHPLGDMIAYGECRILLMDGDPEAAAERCRAAIVGFDETGLTSLAAWAQFYLWRAWWRAGQPERAREAGAEALRRAHLVGPDFGRLVEAWLRDPALFDALESSRKLVDAATVDPARDAAPDSKSPGGPG